MAKYFWVEHVGWAYEVDRNTNGTVNLIKCNSEGVARTLHKNVTAARKDLTPAILNAGLGILHITAEAKSQIEKNEKIAEQEKLITELVERLEKYNDRYERENTSSHFGRVMSTDQLCLIKSTRAFLHIVENQSGVVKAPAPPAIRTIRFASFGYDARLFGGSYQLRPLNSKGGGKPNIEWTYRTKDHPTYGDDKFTAALTKAFK